MGDAPVAPRPVAFRTRLVVAAVPLLIYLVSLPVPALEFRVAGTEPSVMPGYHPALFGALGLLVGNLGWLANIVFLPSLALLLVRQWRTAAACAAGGLVVGLHSLALLGREIPSDASGNNKMVLVHLHVGFYLWLASMLAAVAGALWCRSRE